MSYQINLSANYTSSQEPYLYYNAPDTYGDLNSHFIVAYATADSSGTALDETIGQTDRGGPTGDAGSTSGQGSASFTVGAGEPFQIQVADLMDGTLGSEAYFTQVFLNPSVSDQLQVALTWQPTTLPDIALNSATTTDAQNVNLNYSISGSDLNNPFQVAVYRSPTQSFNSSTAVPVGSTLPIPAVDASGNPSTSQGVHSVVVSLPSVIGPDASGKDPYVFVVANPPGSNHIPESDDPSDANDAAPLALGMITPTAPTWSADGGVNYGYKINSVNLPQATTVALYWAPVTTFDSSQDTLIPDSVVNTQNGCGHLRTIPAQSRSAWHATPRGQVRACCNGPT